MRRRERGQTLVELALMLPVFVMLFLGMIEFGWYIYNYSSLENAARRGSEQAIKEPPLPANAGSTADACVVEIRRQSKLNLTLIQLPDSAVTVAYPIATQDRKLGSEIEVRIQHTGQFLTPLGSRFGAGSFQFDFRSRRTILDTMVMQANARCP